MIVAASYVFLGVLGELTLFAMPPPVQVWQRLRPAFAQVRLQSLCVPHFYISLLRLQPLVDGPFGFSAKELVNAFATWFYSMCRENARYLVDKASRNS